MADGTAPAPWAKGDQTDPFFIMNVPLPFPSIHSSIPTIAIRPVLGIVTTSRQPGRHAARRSRPSSSLISIPLIQAFQTARPLWFIKLYLRCSDHSILSIPFLLPSIHYHPIPSFDHPHPLTPHHHAVAGLAVAKRSDGNLALLRLQTADRDRPRQDTAWRTSVTIGTWALLPDRRARRRCLMAPLPDARRHRHMWPLAQPNSRARVTRDIS